MKAPLAFLVDDHADFRASLELLVRREGFEVQTAGTIRELAELLEKRTPQVVLVDLELPDGNGWEYLSEKGVPEHAEVIVITGHATVESAVQALRNGALDYLTKPVDHTRLKSTLNHVVRTGSLKAEVAGLRGELRRLGRFGPMIGRSRVMQAAFDLITRVAPTNASVLITGESGTGKELVAETIHQLSKRKDKPLCPINCGAVSPTLIESELFGHERGSFTGANKTREGYFELAHGGTLFLDEVTEMPADLQVKLLRVLETGKIMRVGGGDQIAVDVRVIASTNRQPLEAVKEGRLREDLFYRLDVFRIEVPPLRERQGDIELLAQHFLDQLNAESETHKSWTPAALERLARNPWRGNVRELRNAVQRAFILSGAAIGPEAVPAVDEAPTPALPSGITVEVGSSIASAEQRLILATLEAYAGNKAQAAAALGISLKTLYTRLSAYAAKPTGS